MDTEEDINFLIDLINKCPNLEEISFSAFSILEFETFLKIFTSITSKKIKIIECEIADLEPDSDFTPLFNNLPDLEILNIEEHQSMCYAYSVYPVWESENKRIAFPLLEILIKNYLKNEKNYIRLDFVDEFEGFYDYFKDKNDILDKVKSFRGDKYINYELPFIKECSIKKNEDIIKYNVKKIEFLDFEGEFDFNEKVKNFIEKVKPLFISFKKYEKTEIVQDLKKIDNELKAVNFTKLNKIFIKNNSNDLFEEF